MSPDDGGLARLRERLTGRLVLPGDEGYDLARQLQLAEFDAVHPSGVAYCETVEDVRACLRHAVDNGVPLAVRSGGHNFAGWSTTQGLVVDLSRMNHIEAVGGTVRLGPGAQAVDVVTRLAEANLQVAAGICPTVCPAGFISGGGIGWQARKFGLACDRLVSAEVVIADGTVVRCSEDQEPGLFWALRGGGGGNFGIIVDLEVRPTNVPRMVNFMVVWDWAYALDVLYQWQHWSMAAHVELTSEIGVVLTDAAEGAVPTVVMHGAYLGTKEEFDRALAELCRQAGAQPAVCSADELPYAEAMLRLYNCADKSPEQRYRVGTRPEAVLPRQGYLRERHRLFEAPLGRDLLDRAIAAFDQDRYANRMHYLALSALGGAINEVSPTETSYVHRSAQFLVKYTVVGDDPRPAPVDLATAQAWVDQGFALLDPHSNGHSYINYPDPALDDWKWAYYGENYTRLLEVKKTYDPSNVFTFAQSVGS